MPRAITFEGTTWEAHEALRHSHPQIFKNLCNILRELQRSDPTKGQGETRATPPRLEGVLVSPTLQRRPTHL